MRWLKSRNCSLIEATKVLFSSLLDLCPSREYGVLDLSIKKIASFMSFTIHFELPTPVHCSTSLHIAILPIVTALEYVCLKACT